MRSSWIVLVVAAGCYNPKIKSGGLHCGAQSACPDGYSCAVDGRCYRKGLTLDFATSAYGMGGLGALDLSAMSGLLVIDTDSGAMTLAGGDGGSGTTVLAAPTDPNAFTVVSQPSSGPQVALWSFSSLTLPVGMRVQMQGHSVPVLASTGDLVLGADVEFAGQGGLNGGRAMNGSTVGATAGGGGGSDPNASGGGGAGYGNLGQPGSGPQAGIGGVEYGNETLTPVYMGAGGGGGGGMGAGVGGTGGGAVVILAHNVQIGGAIDCGGGDGRAAQSGANAGGGGGGSGGSILISGDSVTFGPQASLLSLGGKGGAGAGTGLQGGDGGNGRIWIGGGSTTSSMPAAVTGSAITMFPR